MELSDSEEEWVRRPKEKTSGAYQNEKVPTPVIPPPTMIFHCEDSQTHSSIIIQKRSRFHLERSVILTHLFVVSRQSRGLLAGRNKDGQIQRS